jgi:diguanylate cyclase (GGDEF)-like protein
MPSIISIDQHTRLPVTKLWNRNHATDRLAQEVSRSAQDPNYHFSILLISFEGLSQITDRLGYASGDDVWRRVLGLLLQDLRASDLCCRLGRDEFVLILPTRSPAECRGLVDRLRRRWNPGAGTREATIEVSIGIACYPAQGASVEQLLGAADEAMHANKVENELVRSAPELRPALLQIA